MKRLPYWLMPAALGLSAVLLMGGCGSAPRLPDWQTEAKGAMDRSVAAYLEGRGRVAAAELDRARSELSRTGRPDLLATAELLHCAARVASLAFGPCDGFEPLRADATEAQRAYADYLRGQIELERTGLLPEAQQAVARGPAGALAAVADPLSRLLAAGVLLQTGRATPAVISQAIDTASGQGWRRPLLAWLGVQLQRAEQGGDLLQTAHLRRRIAIAQESDAGLKPSLKNLP